ncbi:MAG: hypothetical protein ACR2MX_12955 [Cyclobacteriaceae bacterium]
MKNSRTGIARMIYPGSSQRLYAFLLILGAGILLFHTLRLISLGYLEIFVLWVAVLLVLELLVDLGCIISSIRWWITNNKNKDHLPLQLGAAAAIVHVFRVLIYVVGRVGPWINLDIRPEYWETPHIHWSWAEVYFAASMSVLGVIGVIIIWRFRLRAQKESESHWYSSK